MGGLLLLACRLQHRTNPRHQLLLGFDEGLIRDRTLDGCHLYLRLRHLLHLLHLLHLRLLCVCLLHDRIRLRQLPLQQSHLLLIHTQLRTRLHIDVVRVAERLLEEGERVLEVLLRLFGGHHRLIMERLQFRILLQQRVVFSQAQIPLQLKRADFLLQRRRLHRMALLQRRNQNVGLNVLLQTQFRLNLLRRAGQNLLDNVHLRVHLQ